VQLDVRRRLPQGRISGLVAAGELVLDIDTASRALFTTDSGRPIEEALWENASDKTKGYVEAYTRGVNAWIYDLQHGRNGASLPEEYSFFLFDFDEIEPWEPTDSMAAIAVLVEALTNYADDEIAIGETYASVEEEETFDQLFRPWPYSKSTILENFTAPEGLASTSASQNKSAAPAGRDTLRREGVRRVLREARKLLAPLRALSPQPDGLGSNNWAVRPEKTRDGNALLHNDPHLPLTNPTLWYVAHLDAKTEGQGDIHVSGMTFPGAPWMVIGQNEDVAWGTTTTFFDQSDIYIETLSEDGEGVMFNGEKVPFVERDYTYNTADSGELTRTARFVPHHGPVLSIDEESGTALSLRWTANDIGSDTEFLTNLMDAETVDEAFEAAEYLTSTGQNWLAIDTNGNVGWMPYNNVPLRPWASLDVPTWMPIDGTGDYEWQGYYDLEDLPQARNPEAGYIATANNDMTGAFLDGNPFNDGYSVYQSYPNIGFRHERIVDLLAATDEHTRETMTSIAGDDRVLIAEDAIPVFLADVSRDDLSADAQLLYDRIDNWDGDCPTGLDGNRPDSPAIDDELALEESRGCAAFHRVFYEAQWGTFDDEVEVNEWADFPRDSAFLRAFLRPEELTTPDAWWDDVTTEEVVETRADIFTRAFESAAAYFNSAYGDDTDDWLWGRKHFVSLKADLFSELNITTYDDGPFAKDGGLWTVDFGRPANPREGTFEPRLAASMRLQCEGLADGMDCRYQLPGGQRHFRDDANYNNLLPEFFANDYRPLAMSVEAVQQSDGAQSVPVATGQSR
jgi:penicillin amidase